MQRIKQHLYSITSSARTSKGGGTVRPTAFAVLRFMTRSNLVACSTGRSPALAPLNLVDVSGRAPRHVEDACAVGHQAASGRTIAFPAVHVPRCTLRI
jgi:hypothetical protein